MTPLADRFAPVFILIDNALLCRPHTDPPLPGPAQTLQRLPLFRRTSNTTRTITFPACLL
jgi:hypothetical protein